MFENFRAGPRPLPASTHSYMGTFGTPMGVSGVVRGVRSIIEVNFADIAFFYHSFSRPSLGVPIFGSFPDPLPIFASPFPSPTGHGVKIFWEKLLVILILKMLI